MPFSYFLNIPFTYKIFMKFYAHQLKFQWKSQAFWSSLFSLINLRIYFPLSFLYDFQTFKPSKDARLKNSNAFLSLSPKLFHSRWKLTKNVIIEEKTHAKICFKIKCFFCFNVKTCVPATFEIKRRNTTYKQWFK